MIHPKRAFFMQLGIAVAFTLGLSACSGTVSADDDDSSDTKTVSTKTDDDSQTKLNKESSKTSEAVADSSKHVTDSLKATTSETSNDSTENSLAECTASAPTPIVSAVIFQPDSTENKYEFLLVVHGNYPKHCAMTSFDSVVYEFRFNEENPREWKRVAVSDYEPKASKNSPKTPDYITQTYVLQNEYDMCHSYGSVRTIWYSGKEVESSDWSDPVGPLYTLTQAPEEGRTEFTFTEGKDNPCTNSY